MRCQRYHGQQQIAETAVSVREEQADFERAEQDSVESKAQAMDKKDQCSDDHGNWQRHDQAMPLLQPPAGAPEHQTKAQQEIGEPPVEDEAVEQRYGQQGDHCRQPAGQRTVEIQDAAILHGKDHDDDEARDDRIGQ